METIIGILFILLPVILKIIGKKFEQSGATDKARKIREIAQTFAEESPEIYEDEQDDKPAFIIMEEKPVQQPAPAPEASFYSEGKSGVRKPIKKPVKTAEEPQQEKKKEKIDPKKLVLYSEIMKPKF